jgi:hypothetical protein
MIAHSLYALQKFQVIKRDEILRSIVELGFHQIFSTNMHILI